MGGIRNCRWLHDRQLISILGLALLLRVLSAIPFSAHHSDEIWQYLEPAYRLIEGRSVVTWDQRDGIRSWLLPTLITPAMAVGHWLTPQSQSYLLAVRLFLAAMSLVAVVAAFALGSRISRQHGLIAAFVAAIWAELVYMAPRALSEPVSAWAFAAGAALLLTRRGRTDYFAGFLLALAFVFRVHTAPAIAVLVVFSLSDWRYRVPRLIVGGLGALALDSVVNLAHGAPPLMWMVNNVRINLLEGRADAYGVHSGLAYVADLAERWNVLLSPIIVLAVWGGIRYPALLAAAVTHLVVHSFVGHKEWRFDFLFHVIIIILAAVGTGNLIERYQKRFLPVLAISSWIAASAYIALSPLWNEDYDNHREIAAALDDAGRIPASCSVAIYRSVSNIGAAHALLNADREVYVFRDADARAALERSSSSIGAIVTGASRAGELPEDFRESSCQTDRHGVQSWCVYKRAGQCRGSAPPEREINAWLSSEDL